MPAVDVTNRRYWRNRIRFAAIGLDRLLTLKAEFYSPRYTTGWGGRLNV